MAWAQKVRRRAFGIDPAETTFARRGFAPTPDGIRLQLEHASGQFVVGYHAALDTADPDKTADQINDQVAPGFRGFAFEGAAMGFALLDAVLPQRGRLCREFIAGPAANYPHLAMVGIGWAYARFPRPIDPMFERAFPGIYWLTLDGYGFHDAFFHPKPTLELQQRPKRVKGYGDHAFDQGIGRALWFVCGAQVDRIEKTVNGFAAERRKDMWSGVGLAAGYAGGVEADSLRALRTAAGDAYPELAQGVAFAAIAREYANFFPDWTKLASEVICDMPYTELATLAIKAGENLPLHDSGAAYDLWRTRIHAHFVPETKGILA